ncbi:Lipoxygenase [Parasponia andersonii]|uniref:Lipoxygenase n=1 Tax=Parasponia andersonii TaxID=3476 RepID=A0A2P5D8Y7_PARAD|nr:Lipoxygenase [Parasponia andersonii]
MLKPQVQHSHCGQTLFLLNKPFIHGNDINSPFPVSLTPSLLVPTKNNKNKNLRVAFSPGNIKSSLFFKKKNTTKVVANVTVQRVTPKIWKLQLSERAQDRKDKLQDLLGIASFSLELVSAKKDPETGQVRRVKVFPTRDDLNIFDNEDRYEAKIDIPNDFGEVGAIIVENDYEREIYIKDILLQNLPSGAQTINFSCNSWVQSKRDVPPGQQTRIFFSDKSYLPWQTPSGVTLLRKEALERLRGNGQGERKEYERIYDYDVYNDLGEPDKSDDLKRPVLGGKEHPYPRRCRTGRPPTKKEKFSESRSNDFYVPRDESFAEVKQDDFSLKTLYSLTHAVIPFLKDALIDENFPYFTAIDVLYDEGIPIPPNKSGDLKQMLKNVNARIYKAVSDADDFLQFEQPPTMDMDKFFWFRDEEFARQTLAGLNPCCIQLLKEWPLTSTLDPAVYGSPKSKITPEIVDPQIKAYGYNSVTQAIRDKKVYILDYHDVLLPYVSKVRQLKGRTLYGSRTLFFLTPYGTLLPLAIELTRPPIEGKPQWKEVYTPFNNWHSTDIWLWRLAKSHVLAHDSGVHQLVSHWLRTHCAVEPYIIATNRQLSAMHPINRLLKPHFRYTMEINALARQRLINADGVIESAFAPGKYSIELSSAIYGAQWRFDLQALPADLISRGLAVEDKSSKHGLRLTIEDYPYANDGLLIWDSIKQWVSDYVNHYYSNSSEVERDEELQAWWTEIKTKGHPDKEEGWPDLKTREDLIDIVTNIAWTASGHHAAVNFGQYAYAGYFPNRPTITRTNMPSEEKQYKPQIWQDFKQKPEDALLKCFPTQFQAAETVAVLDVLSTHSPDEEYLGDKMETAWGADPVIEAAFKRFNGRMNDIEHIIDERNANEDLRNRHGAGILAYELLKPFSDKGVTNKGVPYSISI